MAYPFTHLCVASIMLQSLHFTEDAEQQFLLGSIAPDAVHYRTGLVGASKLDIGPIKKTSHLCPVSSERWGQVTDNDGWIRCIKTWLKTHPPTDAFFAGYATHCLTDLYNNLTLWKTYSTTHPEDAALGYNAIYYDDLKKIDARLFFEFENSQDILTKLAQAKPVGIMINEKEALVTQQEVHDIMQNIAYEHFKNVQKPDEHYTYIHYDDVIQYIHDAALFCMKHITNF